MSPARKTILDVLTDQKKLDPTAAEQLKVEQVSSEQSLEKVLLERKLVSREDLLQARAVMIGIPYVDLRERAISQELLKLIPEQVSRHYDVLPIEYDLSNDTIHVAMRDPLDFQTRQFLEKKTGKTIKPYLCDADVIHEKIDQEYAKSLATEVSEAVKETNVSRGKIVDADRIGDIIREPPIARIVSTILEFGVKTPERHFLSL